MRRLPKILDLYGQMVKINLKLIIFIIFLAIGYTSVNAQVTEQDDLSPSMKEIIAKGKITQIKEDYQELVERTEKALKISEEIEQSFTKKHQINSTDQKKLKELEKLVKKIRSELGADGDDDDEELPNSKETIIGKLKDSSIELLEEVKKTTRYSISAAAIESSNSILRFVRFLRGN